MRPEPQIIGIVFTSGEAIAALYSIGGGEW